MSRFTYREEVKKLLANMEDDHAEEYTNICGKIDDVIDSLPASLGAHDIITAVTVAVDIEYLPIITAIVADRLGVDLYRDSNPDLILFHRLFEYAYVAEDEDNEVVEVATIDLHTASHDLH